ncbi:MAG: hypothetical protein NTZ32_13605 [Planctomycetales bacterium]|nr:hypothetical protein [Planctomycetales bacterium]
MSGSSIPYCASHASQLLGRHAARHGDQRDHHGQRAAQGKDDQIHAGSNSEGFCLAIGA